MNRTVARLLGLIPYVGLICFVVAGIIGFIVGGTDGWQQMLLANALLFLVGVQGFIYAAGHLFFPDPIAESIGWAKGSPFQWEVGMANLSYGVLGCWASTQDKGWWLAAVVAFAIFYLGAAIGHVRDLVTNKNHARGNTGGVLVVDVLIPVLVIVLYAIAV
jgi:hypothetical protein